MLFVRLTSLRNASLVLVTFHFQIPKMATMTKASDVISTIPDLSSSFMVLYRPRRFQLPFGSMK